MLKMIERHYNRHKNVGKIQRIEKQVHSIFDSSEGKMISILILYMNRFYDFQSFRSIIEY